MQPKDNPQLKPATKTITTQFFAAANKEPGAEFPAETVFDGQTVYVPNVPSGTKAETKTETP